MTVRNAIIVNDWAHVTGGSGKVAIMAALGLAARDVRTTLFTGVGPIAPELLIVPNLDVVCLDQHDILTNPSRANAAFQGLWNVTAARAMSRLLAKLDPKETVVHFHGWTKALSPSVFRPVLRAGFPAVITMHDYFTACPIGCWFNYAQGTICTLKPMSTACITSNCDPRSYVQKLWRVARQFIQRDVARVPSGISSYISISDFSTALLRPYLERDGTHFYNVVNPIDVERVNAATPERNSVQTFIGRISAEKGTMLFAQAAARAAIPGLVVGNGELLDAVKTANPQLEVRGWTNAVGIRKALQESRALVFPSVWYENSPLIVPEAAALGIPAIVPDTSAARDQIIDGETGLLFRGGDVDDLTEKMKMIQASDELTARLGRNAYETYWRAPQTLERHIDQTITAYQQILSAQRTS